MPAKLVLLPCLIGLSLLSSVGNAAFVVSVNPDALRYDGSGIHEIDLFLSFEDSGIDRVDTLDALQIDITNAPNAVVRQGTVPSDITGQFFPSFNVNTGNRFGWGGLGDVSIPTNPGVLLATLTFEVSTPQDFTIGLDFVKATRSSTLVDGDTLGDRGIVSVPSSFTVTAIPEPTSAVVLLSIGAVVCLRRGRRA